MFWNTHTYKHTFCPMILTQNDYVITGMSQVVDEEEADNPVNSGLQAAVCKLLIITCGDSCILSWGDWLIWNQLPPERIFPKERDLFPFLLFASSTSTPKMLYLRNKKKKTQKSANGWRITRSLGNRCSNCHLRLGKISSPSFISTCFTRFVPKIGNMCTVILKFHIL